ncbi:unnamed protein product [Paramecium sonneborni]|uniref:Uncharacterized protein n=1 Tax=Paramecium sonneborni TaxID=65129 RepID=A0A8S1QP61_9CILI|nr:unnamed protein product [Paramecium sonneborni]
MIRFTIHQEIYLLSEKAINDLQVKKKLSKDDYFNLLIQLKDKKLIKQEIV